MKRFLALALIAVMALAFAACSKNESNYNLGNADRARIFYNTYNSFVDKYGEGKSVDGKLSGAAVVRLYDFTGDNAPELLIAYSSEKDGVVDKVMVGGFDMGYAEIYNEEITSKAESNSLWVYTDSSDLSYLVFGEDLNTARSYNTYLMADKDGKSLYSFAEAFSTDGKDLGGVYEKFDIQGADFEAINAENQRVLEALKDQKN